MEKLDHVDTTSDLNGPSPENPTPNGPQSLTKGDAQQDPSGPVKKLKCQEEEAGKIRYFEWDDADKAQALTIIGADQTDPDAALYEKLEKNQKRNWDIFYKNNKANFFKDRHYIDKEFDIESLINIKLKGSTIKYFFVPKLLRTEKLIMHEVGCAVGNTIFPLSQKYSDRLKIYGYDFSPRAIQMIRENPAYDLSKMEADVCDLVNDPIPKNFPLGNSL